MARQNAGAAGGATTTSGIRIVRTLDGAAAGVLDSPEDVSRSEALRLSQKQKKIERASREQLHGDRFLWGIYLMLLCYSIVELYSASSSEIKGGHVFAPIIQHGIYLAMGFVLILVMSNIHYKIYRKTAVLFAILSVGLMIYTMVGGVIINGAQRAIRLGSFTIQPAEIAKLALVVVLAYVIAKHQMYKGVTNTGLFIALAVTALFSALLFKNGLTNTLLIVGTAFSMLIIGGLQMRKLLLVVVVLVGVGLPIFGKKYGLFGSEKEGTAIEMMNNALNQNEVDRTGTQINRIKYYKEGVKPTDKIDDANRQVMYSNFALAHGGVFGNGPGNSRENARLPLAFSDYIYSIIIEDTGIIGGIFLLIMYLSLIGAAGRIAVKCKKAFPALLIMGCAVMIVMQALVHMSIVVGIVPVSGQPLPFISKGGTSVLVMSAAMGMMLSVSKFAPRANKNRKEEALRNAVADNSMESDNPLMIQTKAQSKAKTTIENDPLTY